MSQEISCGLDSGETDESGSSDVLRQPAEPSAPRTTSGSLTVAEELQTEPTSSASPPMAEWKLWLEQLKPLTLSPDDSELSTATNPTCTINAWMFVKQNFVFRVLVHTHIISCEPHHLGPGHPPPEPQEAIRILHCLLNPPYSWAHTGILQGTENQFQRMRRTKNYFLSQETWANLQEAHPLNHVMILQSRAA